MGEKRVTEQVASDEIYNDDWFLKDSILHDTKKVQPSVIKEYVNQGMATSQNLADEATARQNMDNQLASGISKQMSNLADFYDTTKSYVVGDVVMQQSGDLLRCIAPTSGTFDNTKWELVTVDELFDDLNFNAEAISYDNTSSGLEADNVQDAIDEVLETAGKVDDIVSNGQSLVENKIADLSSLTAVGTASGDIATFNDGSDLPMPKLEVAIEPVQDLHGYDSPWVGGSGKNKLNYDAWKGLEVVGGTAVYENNGVTLTSTQSDCYTSFTGWSDDRKIPVSEGETIILSWEESTNQSGEVYIFPNGNVQGLVVRNNNVTKQVTYTVGSGVTFITFRFGVLNANATISYKNIMVRKNGDATFAPYSNICPISGWDEVNVTRTGKNLCKSTIHGYVSSTDDLIVIDNDTESAIFYAHEGQTYTISSSATMNKSRVALVGTDNVVNYTPILQREILSDNINTWTATWTGWTVWYKCGSRQTAFDNLTQVELGSTATTYEPYNGHTYTIDLDGTRYGGKVDLVSGVLTVDRAIVTFDGSSDETISEYSASSCRYRLWISEYRAVAESVLDTKLICSKLKTYTKNNLASDSSILYGLSPSDISSAYIIVKANGITNLADFKTWLSQNELQVVYPLATPITIQLTPTMVKSLVGQNNVWADTGAIIDAEYIRDLSTIINYILEQLGN